MYYMVTHILSPSITHFFDYMPLIKDPEQYPGMVQSGELAQTDKQTNATKSIIDNYLTIYSKQYKSKRFFLFFFNYLGGAAYKKKLKVHRSY